MTEPGVDAARFSTIYWPIETKARELDGALFLSAVAAQRGWSVVIGGKTELYARLKQNANPGIVVDKSIQKGSEKLFKALKQAGHRVYARCEEAIWFVTADDYCNRKTGTEAFREVEAVLAWGREHAEALGQFYPEFSHKVVTTGNVRFDLISPGVRAIYEREVAQIRQTWGDFYLYNTKFTRSNYIKRGPGFVEGMIAKGALPNEEAIRLTTKGLEREKALLPHVVEFIERFSRELPGKKLIIRPHPSEDFALWKRLAVDKANVHVVHEGNVHPWLLASRFSISCDCTTSVESFLLDKPGINFRPVQDEEIEWRLPRTVAYQVETTDHLLRALALDDPRAVLSLPDAPVMEIVGHRVAQYRGTLASNAMLDYFAAFQAAPDHRLTGRNPLGSVNPAFAVLRMLKIAVAWCISRDNRARHRNRAHKFSGLDGGEITARVDEICSTLGYQGVRVKQLADNIFQIAAR